MNLLDFVQKYDPQNQFAVLKNSFRQIEFAWTQSINLEYIQNEKIENIIFTGMGGSAIGGDLLRNFLGNELKIPYQVNRNYTLPAYAGENTLLIVSSYSGNTEETISAAKDGLSRGCQVIFITTGGIIEELAQENKISAVKLKTGFQPRYALWINFFTLLKSFQLLNLIPNQNKIAEASIVLLREKGNDYSEENNSAISLAGRLIGFTPVVYGVSDLTDAVTVRLKSQFNENAKVHAFYNFFPELNHNEIIGWETYGEKENSLYTLFIEDEIYNPRIKERITFTSDLLRNTGVPVEAVSSSQPDFKLRLVDMIYMTDWVTYYLAVLRSKDPSEIDNINLLKDHLAKTKD